MEIQLNHIGKKFQRDWIFKEVNIVLQDSDKLAILGANGSGKSTLLQILSGYLTPSAGAITWKVNNTLISVNHLYPRVSLATPYMALYDEFTLKENIEFFLSFKSFQHALTPLAFAERIGLQKHFDRPLRDYSSGMRQRVKLGLAIVAETDLLLLDEPSSHLDVNAIKWYVDLVEEFSQNRITVVASNKEEAEIPFCTKRLDIMDFKPTDGPF